MSEDMRPEVLWRFAESLEPGEQLVVMREQDGSVTARRLERSSCVGCGLMQVVRVSEGWWMCRHCGKRYADNSD